MHYLKIRKIMRKFSGSLPEVSLKPSNSAESPKDVLTSMGSYLAVRRSRKLVLHEKLMSSHRSEKKKAFS